MLDADSIADVLGDSGGHVKAALPHEVFSMRVLPKVAPVAIGIPSIKQMPLAQLAEHVQDVGFPTGAKCIERQEAMR
jgi:hypothetical protein